MNIIVEPLITREACVNGSGIEEVGSSELETDVLSSPLESKIIFDPMLYRCFQEKKNLLGVSWKTKGVRLRQKQ